MVLAAALGGCASSKHTDPGPSTTTAPTVVSIASSTTAPPASTAPATSLANAPLTQRTEPSLPLAIQEAAAASTGTGLYVVGGYDAQPNSRATVFVFDGVAWRSGPQLPVAVNHPGAAAIGSDVYVAGGFTADGNVSARLFVLSAGSQQWRELAPMHHARGALALLAIDGRLYAIGGRDHSAADRVG